MHAPGADLDVRAYDFERPEILTESQRNRLDSAFETFARNLGLHITAKTRTVVDVDYGAFSIVPFGTLAGERGEPAAHLLAGVEGQKARLVYRIPLTEALFWASRMVGGAGRVPDDVATLTAVERALVTRMADEQLAELQLALEALLPEVLIESFAAELRADAAPADELMLCAAFTARRAGRSAVLGLALPAAPILDAVGHGGEQPSAETVRALLERHVSAVPVEIALRFDETRVGPAIVLGLTEGDLIPLAHPQHRPLALTMDDLPVVRAAVGGNGARLACVVVDS